MSRHSINGGYNYDDLTNITDFSFLVNLKPTGGLNNAFHVEAATGLSTQ